MSTKLSTCKKEFPVLILSKRTVPTYYTHYFPCPLHLFCPFFVYLEVLLSQKCPSIFLSLFYFFRKNGLRMSRIELADKVIDSAGTLVSAIYGALEMPLLCPVDSTFQFCKKLTPEAFVFSGLNQF